MCPHMASITSGKPPCHQVSTLCLSVLSHHLEMFLIETETCPALLGSRLERGGLPGSGAVSQSSASGSGKRGGDDALLWTLGLWSGTQTCGWIHWAQKACLP